MRRIGLVVMLMVFAIPAVYAQTIDVPTYYPSPFGSYARLQIVPRPGGLGVPVCNAAASGIMYLDESGQLMFCVWTGSAGVWRSALSPWTHDVATDNVYLFDDDPDASGIKSFVGIGTQTPADRLDLTDHDGDIRIYDGTDTAHVLGDEASGETNGIVLRPLMNPAAGEPIFVVESSGFSQGLRVEYDGALKTSNDLEVDGTGDSYMMGNLGVGGETTPANQLDVNGAAVVGTTYAGTEDANANGAPNGILVEGKVCIGQTAPTTLPVALSGADAQLSVNGYMKVNNTINFDGGGSITDGGGVFSINH